MNKNAGKLRRKGEWVSIETPCGGPPLLRRDPRQLGRDVVAHVLSCQACQQAIAREWVEKNVPKDEEAPR